MKKYTTEEIIEKFKGIHGDKYDYSLVEYQGIHKKVKIICPIHGVFEQISSNILHRGDGCPKCGKECAGDKKRKSKEQLINEFKEVHGDKYDYSLIEYINAKTKVKIICPIHGVFEQIPDNHKKGHGCRKCADKISSEKQSLSNDTIIKEFQEIHKNKYDYSLVNYKGAKEKVKIICPIHGVFEQAPTHHKKGVGCPKCFKKRTAYNFYKNKATYLYYIKINNQYKIGITSKRNFKSAENAILKGRYKREISKGINIQIIDYKLFEDGYEAYLLEQKIIQNFQDKLINPEDVILESGHTETFSEDVLKDFKLL